MSGDFAFGPMPGLPAPLPEGERLLWQGRPSWRGLRRRAFHVRKIAAYCGLLLLWHVAASLHDGAGAPAIMASLAWMAPLGLAGIALPSFLAWLYARTTIYSITTRRVVIHAGVAMPMTINVPFRAIGSAALKTYADGSGDIPLALAGKDRIAFLHLWPNVRPWRVTRPEPMLRAVPDAGRVAGILTGALRPASVRVVARAHEDRPAAEAVAA